MNTVHVFRLVIFTVKILDLVSIEGVDPPADDKRLIKQAHSLGFAIVYCLMPCLVQICLHVRRVHVHHLFQHLVEQINPLETQIQVHFIGFHAMNRL